MLPKLSALTPLSHDDFSLKPAARRSHEEAKASEGLADSTAEPKATEALTL